MRKTFRLGLALLALLVFAAATGINLSTATRAEFTDCAAGGSGAQTLVAGTYLLRVTDVDTFVCFAASGSTCAANGEKFPAGTVMVLAITGDKLSISCRSAAATGDVILTAAN
jgi:hypothetical protein